MKRERKQMKQSIILLIGKSMGNLLSLTIIFLKWGFDEVLRRIEKFSIEVIPRVFQHTRYYENKRIQENAVKSYDKENEVIWNEWKGTDFTPLNYDE